jgi:hypothetical protein
VISVPHSTDDVFVHVPPRLDLPYLESAISRTLGRNVTICDCLAANLCVHHWGGVSNSGATILRLTLRLARGDALDVVAKILSPDAVNLFKVDCCFSSRLAEVTWAEWWGKQGVGWCPVR